MKDVSNGLDNSPVVRVTQSPLLALVEKQFDKMQKLDDEQTFLEISKEVARFGELMGQYKTNVYYHWVQGGKDIFGPTTLMADIFIRKFNLMIQMDVDYITLPNGEDRIHIRAQGVNPVHKRIEPPQDFYYPAKKNLGKWVNATHDKDGKPLPQEQIEENHQRAETIILNQAKSRCRRDMAYYLVGRDMGKAIAQQAYDLEVSKITNDFDNQKQKLFSAFVSVGVPEQYVLLYLGKTEKFLKPSDIGKMRGIYARIVDSDNPEMEIASLFPGLVQQVNPSELKPQSVKEVLEDEGPNDEPNKPEETPAKKERKKKPAAKKGKKCYVCDKTYPKDEIAATEEKGDICVNCIGNEQDQKDNEVEEDNICAGCNNPGDNLAPLYSDDGNIFNYFCPDCQKEYGIACRGSVKVKGCKTRLGDIHNKGGKLFKRKDGMLCNNCIAGNN